MLQDRVILITGAAGNLGQAVAASAFDAGARLLLLDRSEARLKDVALPTGDRVLAFGGQDLADPNAVARAADAAIARFGGLDGLVSTVGAFRAGQPAHVEDWQGWQEMLDANLRSAVVACQAVVPRLRNRTGRVVTVGARSALRGVGGMAAYGASKAALVRFTESLADEVSAREITANCVLPSIIDTPANRQAMPAADVSRWVAPAAVADVIVFLLSDRAQAVTGASIPVFGRS